MAIVGAIGCEVPALIGSNVGPSGDTLGDDDDDGVGTTHGSSATGSHDDGTLGGGEADSSSGSADTNIGIVFDVGAPDTPHLCPVAGQAACDYESNDPWHAIGINCPGLGPKVEGTLGGNAQAAYVHEGTLGTSGYFAPREGTKMLVLSTGVASEIPLPRDQLCTSCPSSYFGQPALNVLPAPIDVRRVDDAVTCAEDPSLIGTGDCSNTLQDEWTAGSGAYDYVELRMTTEVPRYYDSFRYQFAFFSTEYPDWVTHSAPFNDMYIAWLQSESWTGNISFDDEGHSISIQGVLLDFRDAPAPGCPEPCQAPELAGFSMQGHAGTRWLETTAPVTPGETIELVFALFDLTDGIMDSAVVLDDWDWTCSGEPPITIPAG